MRSWLLIATLLVTAVACGRSGVSGRGRAGDDDDGGDDDDAITPPFCSTSDADLIGCWEFEGDLLDSSASAWAASSGAIAFGPGAVGQAALFSASSFLTLDGTALVVGTASSMTIEAWVNLAALPTVRFGILDRQSPYSVFLYPGGVLRCGIRDPLLYTSG